MRHTEAASGGGSLFEYLVKPLAPFAFKGVAWYQGEANLGAAAIYGELLSGMITDWRGYFNVQKLPFLIVQLPNHKGKRGNPTSWWIPLLREGQAKVAKTVPDVFMAVTADIGMEYNWHPTNKRDVGRRLALKALEHVYGRKLDSSGPVYQRMEKSDKSIRLHFTHVGGGLVAKDGELKGFYIAGSDGNFVPAKTTIEDSTVVVSSSKVSLPVNVRYGWGNWTPCDLYNKANLPAEPFRTDSFPMRPPVRRY